MDRNQSFPAFKKMTTRTSQRSAFTLLELMLVLAMIAVIAALAWPALSSTLATQRLKRSADRVQTELARARNRAMLTGQPQMLRVVLGTGQFRSEPYQGLNYNTSTTSTEGVQALGGANSSANGTPADVRQGQLPDGVVFVAGDAEAARPSTGFGETGGNDAESGWSPPILFYPDGTATPATLLLEGLDQRRLQVVLRGMTGVARTTDPYSDQATNR